MKVLLIGKHPRTGGAAIAASRLMEALRDEGVDVKMLVQEGADESRGIYSTSEGKLKQGLNLFRFIMERLTFLGYEKSKSIRFLFSPANTGEFIHRHPLVKEADIIHLHWINAGFLSLRSLDSLLKLGKPVVWTFHDMWPFTGGCHYAMDCEAYKLECGYCPYLKKPRKGDLSNRIWKRKNRVFKQFSVKVITPSEWLNRCVTSSSLLGHWNVSTIHNPVDHSFFKPLERNEVCQSLELDPEKKYILFGAATMKNILKGFKYFQEAIRILSKEPEISEKVEILLFGKASGGEEHSFPLKTRNIAFVQSQQTLVELYNAAHVFVIPSLQDNLPNTILESMFCGTPVVGFRTGGIPEMIEHRVNGYLSEFKSSIDLAEGMKWVLHSESYPQLSASAREISVRKFSREISVKKHMKVYQDILGNSTTTS